MDGKFFMAASFYMAMTTYCYYEKMCRTMRTAFLSYLLNHFIKCLSTLAGSSFVDIYKHLLRPIVIC